MTTDSAAKPRRSQSLPLRGAVEHIASFLLSLPIVLSFWLLTPLSPWLALAVALLWGKASLHAFRAWQRRRRDRRKDHG